MDGTAETTASDAVARLVGITDVPYRLVGRLSGGETGAQEVADSATGKRFVLKWETDEVARSLRREAVVLTERLRLDGGWPVPRQQTVEDGQCLFVLQQLMPGRPLEEIGHRIVDQLLVLHSKRLGLARPGDPSHWPTALIEILTVGGHGYCRHESLSSHDQRTARLVAGIEEFGRTLRPGDLAGADIVHWDWHPGNLLEVGESLSAVVDTDFVVTGDAAFDLVMLALTSLTVRSEPGVRRRLFRAAFDDLDEIRARAYLGHLFIRLIDWPIRRGSAGEIDFWLDQASKMLRL
ncbi:MAG: aminoglycoside phosphotransferase family protein [Acidimicrobiales bacterium]